MSSVDSPPSDARVLPVGKEVEVFYDGGCPLCRREISFLRRRDRRERILFTDIAADGFEAATVGRSQAELMGSIHGRLPEGRVIVGMEVFRRLYAAVGFGWAAWLTRLPGICQLCDVGYRLFARNRLRMTGRCRDGSCSIE